MRKHKSSSDLFGNLEYNFINQTKFHLFSNTILLHFRLIEKKCHKRHKQAREYKEVQDLTKLIENHEKIYQELQEQQKVK